MLQSRFNLSESIKFELRFIKYTHLFCPLFFGARQEPATGERLEAVAVFRRVGRTLGGRKSPIFYSTFFESRNFVRAVCGVRSAAASASNFFARKWKMSPASHSFRVHVAQSFFCAESPCCPPPMRGAAVSAIDATAETCFGGGRAGISDRRSWWPRIRGRGDIRTPVQVCLV